MKQVKINPVRKQLLILLHCLIIGFAVKGQAASPNYDSSLAKSLGADEYGMKMYVLVILKTGSNKIEDKAKLDSLFAGHLANIGRLANEQKLIIAGPLGKNEKSYRGIFVLNVKTFEEANALLQTDPAIKAKLLEAELYNWYGSAALSAYLPVHEKIAKQKP